jgi:hypothetical protein
MTANSIDHILRINCLSKHTIQGKEEGGIEMTEKQGRRGKQLLNYLGGGYWKLKEEALDRTVWKSGLGRGYRHVVRQTNE